jgi:LuxR family transcriptional regulator, quorum-sensing system regulator BjaR1
MGLSDLDYYAAFSNARLTFPAFRNDENFSNEDLEILHAIASARSAKPCNEAFALATRRFGNDAFACGEVDVTKRDRVVFFSMEWSEVWRIFYLESFLHRDPMLHLLEQADEPFTWGEWKDSKRLSAEERDAFILCGKHGWVDGFLPIRRKGPHVALVSVVCTKLLDPAADKAFLTHASFCYLERIRGVIAPSEFPVAPLGLTPRELECLGLVAQGYSDRRIAQKLGVSVATAHEHVQRAMQRLGVTSRSEAVALAISFGAIRV